MTLSSAAYLDIEPSDEPHVPWARVVEHAEGLILLSGGPDGPVDPLFAAGRTAEANAALADMQAAFGDRFYVELQRHGLADRGGGRAGAGRLGLRARRPAGGDQRRLLRRSGHARGARCAALHRRRRLPRPGRAPAGHRRALRSRAPRTCATCSPTCRRPATTPSTSPAAAPSWWSSATRSCRAFPTSEGRTEDEELALQAREGLAVRLKLHPPAAPIADYYERLEREIGLIQSMGFSGYFLIVSDFMKWAVAHGIPVGPGRGSGAGSLVAWSLLITGSIPSHYRPAVRGVPQPGSGVDAGLRHRLLPGAAGAR